MEINEDSMVVLNSVKGIENVRPPTLNFKKVKDTNEYIEYKIRKIQRKKNLPRKGVLKIHLQIS